MRASARTFRYLVNAHVTRLVGLEPDRDLARRVEPDRHLAPGNSSPSIEIRHGGLSDLPLDERYDTIVYIDVLEHIEKDRDEVRRPRRDCIPAVTSSFLPRRSRRSSASSTAPSDIAGATPPRRLKTLTPETLEVIDTRYLDSLGACLSAANRLVLRRSMPTTANILFWDRYVVPASRVFDHALGRFVGRSVVCIWKKKQLARRSAVLATTLALASAATLAYFRAFSFFGVNDDEGYIQQTVRSYLEGHRLFDEIFTQYGPAFYVLESIIHRTLGAPLSHDVERFVTIGIWVSASAAIGWAVLRITRSWIAAALTFAGVFVHLMPLISEPGHPHGPLMLVIALMVLVGAWHSGTISPRQAALAGALTAFALFVKINIGVYLAIGFALPLLFLIRPLNNRLLVAMCLAGDRGQLTALRCDAHLRTKLGVRLCDDRQSERRVIHRRLCARTPWGDRRARPSDVRALYRRRGRVPGRACSSAGDVNRGADRRNDRSPIRLRPSLLHAAHSASLRDHRCRRGVGSGDCAGASSAATGRERFDRGRGKSPGGRRWVISRAVRVRQSTGVFHSVPLDSCVALGQRHATLDSGRAILVLIAVLQSLQAYPVAGTQMAFATVLMIPIAFVCAHDALTFLAERFVAVRWLPRAVQVACIAAGILFYRPSFTAAVWRGAYDASSPPG